MALFLANVADKVRTAHAAADLRTARKLVNGGSHGLDRFKDVFDRAAQVWPAMAPAGSVARRPTASAPAGGKKLYAFELVTAIYAVDKFNLREDWSGSKSPISPGRLARMIGSPNRRDVLTEIASTDFLQACTLLHTRELRLAKIAQGLKDKEVPQISYKRDAFLALPKDAYLKEHNSSCFCAVYKPNSGCPVSLWF